MGECAGEGCFCGCRASWAPDIRVRFGAGLDCACRVLYALSGDARRRTSFPDGRRVLDISAGDQYGQAVSDCIQISVVNRNVSGGN